MNKIMKSNCSKKIKKKKENKKIKIKYPKSPIKKKKLVKTNILENLKIIKSSFHEEKLNLKENKLIIKKEDLNTKQRYIK